MSTNPFLFHHEIIEVHHSSSRCFRHQCSQKKMPLDLVVHVVSLSIQDATKGCLGDWI